MLNSSFPLGSSATTSGAPLPNPEGDRATDSGSLPRFQIRVKPTTSIPTLTLRIPSTNVPKPIPTVTTTNLITTTPNSPGAAGENANNRRRRFVYPLPSAPNMPKSLNTTEPTTTTATSATTTNSSSSSSSLSLQTPATHPTTSASLHNSSSSQKPVSSKEATSKRTKREKNAPRCETKSASGAGGLHEIFEEEELLQSPEIFAPPVLRRLRSTPSHLLLGPIQTPSEQNHAQEKEAEEREAEDYVEVENATPVGISTASISASMTTTTSEITKSVEPEMTSSHRHEAATLIPSEGSGRSEPHPQTDTSSLPSASSSATLSPSDTLMTTFPGTRSNRKRQNFKQSSDKGDPFAIVARLSASAAAKRNQTSSVAFKNVRLPFDVPIPPLPSPSKSTSSTRQEMTEKFERRFEGIFPESGTSSSPSIPPVLLGGSERNKRGKPRDKNLIGGPKNLKKPRTDRGDQQEGETTPIPQVSAAEAVRLFEGFVSRRDSRLTLASDARAELMKQIGFFLGNVAQDLNAYAEHAGRRTVEHEDALLLLQRQRVIDGDRQPLAAVAHRLLPREMFDKVLADEEKAKKREKPQEDTEEKW